MLVNRKKIASQAQFYLLELVNSITWRRISHLCTIDYGSENDQSDEKRRVKCNAIKLE
jgi:hypothetical protein